MSITRVQYRERQRLTAADLHAEQDYRLGLAGRHHLAHHTWGVVRGLRVHRNEDTGLFTLMPGVAIDGYGREILVLEPLELAIEDPESCAHVVLHYCEYPEQVPASRGCKDEPAPRIAHRAIALPAPAWFEPDAENVSQARAAGSVAGRFPWPVVVARVGAGCPPIPTDPEAPKHYVRYSGVRYASHRASVVNAPTGRARLKLGLASRSDVYHFLLTTRDPLGAMNHRLGIDRDGTVHVWRPLFIAGVESVATVAFAGKQLLMVSMPATGPPGSRFRITGNINPVSHTLSATLRELGGALAGPRAERTETSKFNVIQRQPLVVPFGRTRVSFQLHDASGKKVAFPRLPKVKRLLDAEVLAEAPAPAEPAPIPFAASPQITGGKLQLLSRHRETAAVTVSPCGEGGGFRTDGGDRGTPVLQLRPAASIVADPLAREIHSVVTSKPTDSVPRTELRISGGVEDESDASGRVTVGVRVTDAGTRKFVPILRMDGGRRVEILAASAVNDAPLVSAEGTVYLPPIGKKDPLLAELMTLAYMNGLRQVGRLATATITLTMIEPAPPSTTIVRGRPLKYTLKVEGVDEIKRCIQVVAGTEGSGEMTFHTIPGIGKGAAGQKTVTTKAFTHSASKVRLEIHLLVREGTQNKVFVFSQPFDVADT